MLFQLAGLTIHCGAPVTVVVLQHQNLSTAPVGLGWRLPGRASGGNAKPAEAVEHMQVLVPNGTTSENHPIRILRGCCRQLDGPNSTVLSVPEKTGTNAMAARLTHQRHRGKNVVARLGGPACGNAAADHDVGSLDQDLLIVSGKLDVHHTDTHKVHDGVLGVVAAPGNLLEAGDDPRLAFDEFQLASDAGAQPGIPFQLQFAVSSEFQRSAMVRQLIGADALEKLPRRSRVLLLRLPILTAPKFPGMAPVLVG